LLGDELEIDGWADISGQGFQDFCARLDGRERTLQTLFELRK
jgi:hypothetical protein